MCKFKTNDLNGSVKSFMPQWDAQGKKMKICPPRRKAPLSWHSPLGKGGCRRQGGVYKIDVSIENQRFTTLTWKTIKTVFHNTVMTRILFFKGGVKDIYMKKMKILNLHK
jgi:hypothetical protein